jgi:hypothetical protein
MLPLALLMVMLGWFDAPPRPAELPPPASRVLTREELLQRRRDGRAGRRERRKGRVAASVMPHRVQNRS